MPKNTKSLGPTWSDPETEKEWRGSNSSLLQEKLSSTDETSESVDHQPAPTTESPSEPDHTGNSSVRSEESGMTTKATRSKRH